MKIEIFKKIYSKLVDFHYLKKIKVITEIVLFGLFKNHLSNYFAKIFIKSFRILTVVAAYYLSAIKHK